MRKIDRINRIFQDSVLDFIPLNPVNPVEKSKSSQVETAVHIEDFAG